MSNDNATLTACREALAAMEQAEAAMTQGPWAGHPGAISEDYGHAPYVLAPNPDGLPLPDYVATCALADADAAGIALLRNAAPGNLRFMREMLAMCREWLLSENHRTFWLGSPDDTQAAKELARHDAALAILAGLARALEVK